MYVIPDQQARDFKLGVPAYFSKLPDMLEDQHKILKLMKVSIVSFLILLAWA